MLQHHLSEQRLSGGEALADGAIPASGAGAPVRRDRDCGPDGCGDMVSPGGPSGSSMTDSVSRGQA